MSSPKNGWRWLSSKVIYAVHDEQLAEHGGLPGLRDENALQSALARPEQLANYGEPDVCDLAAAYAFGIARNYPFSDGNKRTAFVALELFLALNHVDLIASDADCVVHMLELAAGNLSEDELALWIRAHSASR